MKPNQPKKPFSPLLALGLVVLSTCVFVPHMRGDAPHPPHGERAPRERSIARAPLVVTSAASTCEACPPDQTSVSLGFSDEVRPSEVARALGAYPSLVLVPASDDAPTRHVLLTGAFAERRTYRFTLPDSLRSVAGATIAASFSFTMTTGSYEPIARMPLGQAVVPIGAGLPMQLAHVRSVRLRLFALGAGDLEAAARITGWHEQGTDPVASLPLALRAREKVLRPTVQDGDEDGVQEVDVFTGAGVRADRSAPVLVVLDAPGVDPKVTVVQRADLGIVLKAGRGGGLAWVTDGSSGAPLPGASVTIYDGDLVRFRGTTRADGVVMLPARSELERPANARNVADAQDDDEEDFEGEYRSERPLRAVVAAGGRMAFASTIFEQGIESWRTGLPGAWTEGPNAVRGMVTAERGIYRPGEGVHLLGALRRRATSGRLVAPRGDVSVRVTDPDGTEFLTRSVALTAFGTFRLDTALPPSARLGRYSVEVTKDESTVYARFEVGEYRTASFEVKLPPAGEAERDAEGSVLLPVRAAYYYGAPVRGGRVAWSASWRGRAPSFPSLETFSFAGAGGDGDAFLTSGELELDAAGLGTIRVPAEALAPTLGSKAQAVELVVEAQVTDAADDMISASTVQSLARAQVLVGVESDRWVVDVADGWNVRVAAVDALGAAKEGQALVASLVRQTWVSAAEEGADGPSYGGRYEDRVVATKELVSSAQPVRVHFDVPGGGDYRVEVRAAGASGIAAASVWAYGGSDFYGPSRNDALVDVRPDRASYAPGQTAHLVVASPFEQATALVTTEREGILEAHVVALRGANTPLDVLVREGHVPNVYVGVSLVPRGAAGAAPASGSPLKVGYATLAVSAEARRLSVELTPRRDEMRPGEMADVGVRVRDAEGRPVRAEVTLWAADEGVLALTGYATPDPFAPAYTAHPHAVSTSSNYTQWSSHLPGTWEDSGVGDGGPAESESAALRSRFLSTAFFSVPVVTDGAGQARVRFPLPDNLTRWRVMAAVADEGERFGKGETSIRASKPLQVTPSLPRFFTQGDLVDAGAVVHNDTGSDGLVEVRFEVTGAELAGDAVQRLEVPAGAQLPVRVALRATGVGDVVVRVRAAKGAERDGFELTLPAYAPTTWQSKQLGDGVVDGTATTEVTLPDGVAPGLAELVVTYSPTVLASIESGLESLVEYPNGCVEQTTSRLIPMVLLEDLLRGLGSARFDGAAHRARMEASIVHVLAHQNDDGGFGLWPNSESEGFLTAYALWGLLTSRDHGYAVPQPRVAAAIAYLSQHATQGDDMHGQFSTAETAPFAAYVLAYARQGDGGLGAQLTDRRAALSRFGLGLLASALERREANADALLGELDAARSARSGGGVLVRDPSTDAGFMSFGRDLRATSSAVQALVAAGKTDQASDLVAGILAERRPDGSWGTTYNNLWALYALSTYADSARKSAEGTIVVVRLDGRELARTRIGAHTQVERISVPYASLVAADGRPRRLEIVAPRDAAVRWSARLRYATDLEHQSAESSGLTVSRTLLDADTGALVTSPRVGQLLRVRLSVTSTADREQVALTDRLPAGLEPVDTNLETEQRRVQTAGDDWTWSWRELHDERVAYFADDLSAGTHTAEYLARATRSGEFLRPAISAEAMYDPDVHGTGTVERLTVTR
jgi:uncharacterized protein YfaS (alpha-2-macroglobulin family)